LFLNRDPIAEAGGLNLYGFAGNDGINHVDYLGQFSLKKFLKKYWKPIVAIALSIVTYGAVSALVSSALNATTMTVAASGAVTVTATGSGLMAASLAAASGTVGGIVGGAAAGFVGGATLTALNGGDLNQVVSSGMKGAAAGAIMGGIAGYYGQDWTLGRVATTTVGGGIASEVSGGSFRQGALISGAISLVTYGAIKMREFSVAQSKLDSRNASKDSVGFNGDNFGAGGGRFDERQGAIQVESPLGGVQGGQGVLRLPLIGRIAYARGSFLDRVIEAYSGVHDFFNNPWGYDPATGNYNPQVSIFGRHLEAMGISASRVSAVMNWVDVPLTTPIVATSVLGVYTPAYVSTYNQSRGGGG